MLRFIHAADIHLDSPLRGLDRREEAPAERIRDATRRALENLVDLALEEKVDLLLIAGDIYDGDWRDWSTGRFFHRQMVRLRDGGVRVLAIRGNHDAASVIAKRLELPENVTFLSHRSPETVELEDLGVAVHGQGFAKPAVTEDLSAGYPAPLPGLFNIGLLHTSADGREGHARYAPCHVESLADRGYDYWALGHVHQREILREDPWIVFPGNLQGRHVRETGAKGSTLVAVEDGQVASVEHRPLDVVRWARVEVDATGCADPEEVVERIGERLGPEVAAAGERPLALRFRVTGTTEAHGPLRAAPERWREEVRARATDASAGAAWLEKVEWRTSPPGDVPEATDEAVKGLVETIRGLRGDDAALAELAAELAPLREKLPRELREGEDRLDLESPGAMRAMLDDVEGLLLARFRAGGDER